jgi:hypothetical protein
MIPSDGESRSRVDKRLRGGIFPLIQALGIEIHRHVERVVDKVVDNNCKSSNDSNLYLIA